MIQGQQLDRLNIFVYAALSRSLGQCDAVAE